MRHPFLVSRFRGSIRARKSGSRVHRIAEARRVESGADGARFFFLRLPLSWLVVKRETVERNLSTKVWGSPKQPRGTEKKSKKKKKSGGMPPFRGAPRFETKKLHPAQLSRGDGEQRDE